MPPMSVGPDGVGAGVGLGVGGAVGFGVGSGVGVRGGGGGAVRAGGAVGARVGSVAATSVGVGDGVGLAVVLAVGLGTGDGANGGGVTSMPAVKPKRGSSAKSDVFGVPLAAGRGDVGNTTTWVGARSTRLSLLKPRAFNAPPEPASTVRLEPNLVPGGPPPFTE